MGYTQGRDKVLRTVGNIIQVFPSNLPPRYDSWDGFLEHSLDTYDCAWETMNEILGRYPEAGREMSPEDTSMAGGLHDIGMVLDDDRRLHTAKAARYVERQGERLGIAESEDVAYRIAQMIRPHGLTEEEIRCASIQLLEDVGVSEPGGGFDTTLYHQATVPECVVTHSDIRALGNGSGFDGAMERYGQFSLRNHAALRNGGGKRIRRLFDIVEAMSRGEMDVSRCGLVIGHRTAKS